MPTYQVDCNLSPASGSCTACCAPANLDVSGRCCHMELLAQSPPRNPAEPPTQCAWIGANAIVAFDYQGSDGRCYHADWNGTVAIACSTSCPPPRLPGGSVPAWWDPFWLNSCTHADCRHYLGDLVPGMYGAAQPIGCGHTADPPGHPRNSPPYSINITTGLINP